MRSTVGQHRRTVFEKTTLDVMSVSSAKRDQPVTSSSSDCIREADEDTTRPGTAVKNCDVSPRPAADPNAVMDDEQISDSPSPRTSSAQPDTPIAPVTPDAGENVHSPEQEEHDPLLYVPDGASTPDSLRTMHRPGSSVIQRARRTVRTKRRRMGSRAAISSDDEDGEQPEVTPSRQWSIVPAPWTDDEDDTLISILQNVGPTIDWTAVADELEKVGYTRSVAACKRRQYHLIKVKRIIPDPTSTSKRSKRHKGTRKIIVKSERTNANMTKDESRNSEVATDEIEKRSDASPQQGTEADVDMNVVVNRVNNRKRRSITRNDRHDGEGDDNDQNGHKVAKMEQEIQEQSADEGGLASKRGNTSFGLAWDVEGEQTLIDVLFGPNVVAKSWEEVVVEMGKRGYVRTVKAFKVRYHRLKGRGVIARDMCPFGTSPRNWKSRASQPHSVSPSAGQQRSSFGFSHEDEADRNGDVEDGGGDTDSHENADGIEEKGNGTGNGSANNNSGENVDTGNGTGSDRSAGNNNDNDGGDDNGNNGNSNLGDGSLNGDSNTINHGVDNTVDTTDNAHVDEVLRDATRKRRLRIAGLVGECVEATISRSNYVSNDSDGNIGATRTENAVTSAVRDDGICSDGDVPMTYLNGLSEEERKRVVGRVLDFAANGEKDWNKLADEMEKSGFHATPLEWEQHIEQVLEVSSAHFYDSLSEAGDSCISDESQCGLIGEFVTI